MNVILSPPIILSPPKRRHVFRMDHPCLKCTALGNHAAWAIALRHVAARDGFEAFVAPRCDREDLWNLWESVFPGHVLHNGPTAELASAPGTTISSPDETAKAHGLTAPTIWENALWEHGFALSDGEKIVPPVVWKSNRTVRAAMLYPVEHRHENRYYDLDYWLRLIQILKADGWTVNLLGEPGAVDQFEGARGGQFIADILSRTSVDKTFPPTIGGLRDCIAASSVAVGSSTGPTWACLLSDICQIVLRSPEELDSVWSIKKNFARVEKAVPIVEGKDLFVPDCPDSRNTQVAPLNGKNLHVHFEHGLGDSANFARMLPLYSRRGIEIEVSCPGNKRFIFEAVGAKVVENCCGANPAYHPWLYPESDTIWEYGHDWAGNKTGGNLSRHPLPDIGSRDELWPELCRPIDISGAISAATWDRVDRSLSGLPRPIVLLHTMGNTNARTKNLSPEFHPPFYKAILDRTEGTVILLDWDRRMPRIAHHRLRHHLDQFGDLCTEDLFALMHRSQLLIGVDSGPLHAAGLTPIPRVGIFPVGHYPSTYLVPRDNTLAITLAGHVHGWNTHKRIQFGIVEHPGNQFEPETLAELALQMLGSPRYLPDGPLATDVQLRQFVRWCNGYIANGLSEIVDRHHSFDLLLRTATERGLKTWVETGCIRCEEDWAGAGFSTYLFGAYLSRAGGKLHSVDLDAGHCEYARRRTAVFGEAVKVHESRGDDFLSAFDGPIDVLYCDSCDTTIPTHAFECLQEVKAALPKLHERSLVLFDDTPGWQGGWIGKGAQAVPFLLREGWKILYGGYQVLMSR